MYMEECRAQLISNIILVCAVVHSCCILFGDEWEEEDENNDHDQRDNDEIPLDGDNIREILEAYLSSISYGI